MKAITTLAVLPLSFLINLSAAHAVVTFDWATVGNPGNIGELSGANAGGYGPIRVCGAVNYTYRISKHEVTNAQYVDFLNAVAASDPYGLYYLKMGSHARGRYYPEWIRRELYLHGEAKRCW